MDDWGQILYTNVEINLNPNLTYISLHILLDLDVTIQTEKKRSSNYS